MINRLFYVWATVYVGVSVAVLQKASCAQSWIFTCVYWSYQSWKDNFIVCSV